MLRTRANLALGRLDGVVDVIPDPDFFVAMYVRREAVLSSQIEGTQSTLEDLLEVELEPTARGSESDVGEIVNYVSAMNLGLARLDELPLSLRLIREIHTELLRAGRRTSSAFCIGMRTITSSPPGWLTLSSRPSIPSSTATAELAACSSLCCWYGRASFVNRSCT